MRRSQNVFAAIAAVVLLPAGSVAVAAEPGSTGLTAVAGVKVGHHTLEERPTGCTVILTEGGAVGGVDVRGGAPATRETDLLDPVNSVQEVHAVVLSGGSAFGLDAASGVVRYLEEREVGYQAGPYRVPIVVGASLFDLPVGGRPEIRPTADCGYRAARAATAGAVVEGSVGAGAGATVGKLGGRGRFGGPMKAGVGTASLTMPNGLVVAALVVTNAVGDVVDPATGRVIAGVRRADGSGLADARRLLRSGVLLEPAEPGNTTIGMVATNARLDKAQATKVAQMAHDGYARAIVPAHTPADGDTIFVLATGTWEGAVDLIVVGALGAEVMADAVVRSALQAEGLPGLPAAGELGDGGRSAPPPSDGSGEEE